MNSSPLYPLPKTLVFTLFIIRYVALSRTLPTPETILAKKLDQELPQIVSNYCESQFLLLELLSLRMGLEMQKLLEVKVKIFSSFLSDHIDLPNCLHN